jgi:putative lipoprotein
MKITSLTIVLAAALLGGCAKDAGTEPSSKPDASLTNTYWRVTVIADSPAQPGADRGELNLILGESAKGYSGCNRFTGAYESSSGAIKIGPLAATRKMCMQTMDQEMAYLKSLEESRRYEIIGDNLTLFSGSGDALLRFEAVYLP